ncbi:hypothetical protein FRB95_000463 [Tulasnella sp. JGI-2019a]|nr:hypothetical protein FRB93_002440 [Tulasnella sp. JGI-2019a]KAG9033208.1 hypothetical protein FRB95_000463 [Tulasnella sp. JGI-2019a]
MRLYFPSVTFYIAFITRILGAPLSSLTLTLAKLSSRQVAALSATDQSHLDNMYNRALCELKEVSVSPIVKKQIQNILHYSIDDGFFNPYLHADSKTIQGIIASSGFSLERSPIPILIMTESAYPPEKRFNVVKLVHGTPMYMLPVYWGSYAFEDLDNIGKEAVVTCVLGMDLSSDQQDWLMARAIWYTQITYRVP